LKEHYPHQIILTGGHDNEETGHAIQTACPWVLNLVQKTTLEETATLLQESSMLVSTDTGVMHLGFAIGSPTLALLHYRSPASMYGPLDYSPGHQIIELERPKQETTQEDEILQNEMHQIPFEKVTAAMERILKIS
jgi:ADP-heptose:LPS heptosyltransferase